MENISIVDAGIIALLGYAVVFFGLILLMLVVMGLGKVFQARQAKSVSHEAVHTAPAAAHAAAPAHAPAAPGAAGKLKLYDVEPKTAAMIMAIVANQMGKPINELRFISIKEVK